MTQIIDAKTGQLAFTVNGNILQNRKGHPVYQINGDLIHEIKTGHAVFKINGNLIQDINAGHIVFQIQ